MSYYYKYNFTTPEQIYSTVKEELKSYFDTGAVDDLLFPTYLDKCLKKLGRSSYVITEEVIEVDDFQARLPDNFYAVREAWMLTNINETSYQNPNSFYSQSATATVIQISPVVTQESSCNNSDCVNPDCNGDCMPELIQAVYKTTNSTQYVFRREYLLKPGNISASRQCDVNYRDDWNQFSKINTPGSSDIDSFDIRDNKFVTNFRRGHVQIVFYAFEYDDLGNQLIPDNYRIKEYVEAFIKYKVFEMLTNQTNDETFNQLQQKLVYYKQLADEAYIMAELEIKKQDAYTKQRRTKNVLNRFNMYELPNRTNRTGWRRN